MELERRWPVCVAGCLSVNDAPPVDYALTFSGRRSLPRGFEWTVGFWGVVLSCVLRCRTPSSTTQSSDCGLVLGLHKLLKSFWGC